ncbi:MAG: efflux RND transporter permease subunit, partial [Pseudomonadota bacterium]
IDRAAAAVKALIPFWAVRAVLTAAAGYGLFLAAMAVVNPAILGLPPGLPPLLSMAPGAVLFVVMAVVASVLMTSVQLRRRERRVRAGYRRSPFGWFIHLITGNPVMPLVMIAAVGAFVVSVFLYFGENNNGVEFFVETEPENAIVYVRARGNLSVAEKDAIVRQVELIALDTEGVRDVFAFAGSSGLNQNTGGASAPADTIGQVQIDLLPWDERRPGTEILGELSERLAVIPGIEAEVFEQASGPASGKPVNLELTGEDWEALQAATHTVRAQFEALPGLILVEDTLPLPGIDWQVNVDVEDAGRYGADVATVGAMVQLVTRGILMDTMRVPSSDDEIEIRVRFPEDQRLLSTLETLRVRTNYGLVPISNFITLEPTPQLAIISRLDQRRILQVRADVEPGLVRMDDADGTTLAVLRTLPEGESGLISGPDGIDYEVYALEDGVTTAQLADVDGAAFIPVTPTERIEQLTEWLSSDSSPLPPDIGWAWGGDQQEQQESGEFLAQAFLGALGLMFIILLAQFNSVYNSILVLLAVVLSTTGVLIGMLVMDQTFSIIMTGTGIVALAGIVVNNNIVLIDTYQEYSRYMPRLEAITRTAEARIRPVLLTTITTMAGLAPMMYGISLDFGSGGYTVDSPTALWWKQLATAVVFGLGIATVLTLIFTPSLLALRVWAVTILSWIARAIGRLGARRVSARAQDWILARQARRAKNPTIVWDEDEPPLDLGPPTTLEKGDRPTDPPLRAAE